MRPMYATLASILLLTTWVGRVSAADPAPRTIRAVLWIGGHSHDFDVYARLLTEILPKLEAIEIDVVRDGKFLNAPTANQIDLILMDHCFDDAKGVLDDVQRQKLLDMVRGGVGVVGVHASYFSFVSWKEFRDLFGASWLRHGRENVYLTLRVTDAAHPITKGLPATLEVKSELYESTPLAEDCHVLAVAKERGRNVEHPSVWTRTYGRGRVVTILPGHTEAYKVPEFQKLIAASARWAARADPLDRGTSRWP